MKNAKIIVKTAAGQKMAEKIVCAQKFAIVELVRARKNKKANVK